MRRLRRSLATAALSAVALTTPAVAQDTAAVAVNTKDGHDVFRLAFAVRRVMSDEVTTGNAAVAFASCTDCQTVALAFQVVLILSDPEVVAPTNLALAYNYECSLCDTLASAYQLVLTTGGPVRFTAEGNRRLAELRQRLLALRHSGLTGPEVQAQVDAVASELREVVATELVPAGSSGDAGEKAPTSSTTAPDPGGSSTSSTSTTSTTSSTGAGTATTSSTAPGSTSTTSTTTGGSSSTTAP